jgi:demethylmenaquinone methyltransferase/2-methoxy-6-polyprenyl-1,4-benzoquinol methylase
VVLEITPPGSAIPRGLLALDLGRVVPWLARRYGRSARELMEYHGATIAQCVPPATIVEALRSSGFARVRRRVEVGIFGEYSAVAA